MLGLINEVLDLSRIEANRMELCAADFDLSRLLDGLARMFPFRCQEKGLAWSLEAPQGGPLPVHGDEGKLRQVLSNLLGNAVEFTPVGQVRLRVRREAGDCWTFAVTLPSAHAAPAAPAPASLGAPRAGRVRTLVVDDVPENSQVLGHLLGELGAEAETAAGGAEALERMAARPPDIVFMDIRMPEIDGRETLRRARLRPELADVPAAAVSASVLGHEQQEYLDAGFADFVAKPFRLEEVAACLQRHLGVAARVHPEPPPASPSADCSGLRLPAGLLWDLRQVASLNSITDLERHLRDLQQLGQNEEQLTAHLRRLRQRFDMPAIRAILEEGQHG